jgi:SAM-dependent methyltransferase
MSTYDAFARFYDLEHHKFDQDLDLYLHFASRCDGPVLELGCGSGRVSLALASAGFDVTGIDHSAAMLALARARAADVGLGDLIQLEQIDVRSIVWDERFALAIYPLNGFLHLPTEEDQHLALRNVHRALLPGGFLLVDLPNPHVVFTPDADGQLYLRKHFQSPEGNTISSCAVTQTDLANQVQELTLVYDEVDQDGLVHRTTVETRLRFVYRYEMTGLLREAGFKIDAVYGTYDLDPYQASSDVMFFVAFK